MGVFLKGRHRPVPSSPTLRYRSALCCWIGRWHIEKRTMNSSYTTLILPIPKPFLGFRRRIGNSILFHTSWSWDTQRIATRSNSSKTGVTARDRSKNRKPLQRGRYLSIEAIQTVQILKRTKSNTAMLEQAYLTSFSRLLKLDMIAVLRELLRQNECYLALKVR